MKRTILWLAVVAATLFVAASAYAIPNLTVYSPEENVYYDTDSETWIIPYTDYELWVIGAEKEVYDVKLGLAVPDDEDGSITINGNLLDETLLVAQSDVDPNTHDSFFVEGGTPLMGDGGEVPGGGIFPSDFYQYYIGDFGLVETVHNYIPGGFDDTAQGEIKSFTISVEGYSSVDLIAYDHVVVGKDKAKYVKTPYSHDGGSGGTNPVPEPASMLLFGSGLVGLGITMKRKLKGSEG